MRSGAIPFQFDLADPLGRLRRLVGNRRDEVSLVLPFVSVTVSPKDRERQVAREIVIWLKDRRVLSAWECCDDCIDQALASLQEIRRKLVDKQVELADMGDGPLYLVIETMVAGIRQFLTYEQRLTHGDDLATANNRQRARKVQQGYFDGLEMLRGHLSRSLAQVAVIAGMEAPADGLLPHYQGPWELEAYQPLPPPLP
jgi:hypothetical protein